MRYAGALVDTSSEAKSLTTGEFACLINGQEAVAY